MIKRETKGENVIPSLCYSHCGGACLLKFHVKGGLITRIETDDGEEPQLRACQKGRAYRQMVYAPDRILYPLKRVGERGKGKFERISWDEALDTVATQLKRVRDTYGPLSILYLSLFTQDCRKLLAMAGGFTTWWGATSFHGGMFASFFSYGTLYASNTRDDLPNSRLILMWGWDPAVTLTGTNSAWFLSQAKEKGTRIIAIDPTYNDSAATFADQWIPIRPGTDAAMAIAMAYVMIAENLQDQSFLDKYTLGFDKFRDYVFGLEDGVAKTPAWAEAITTVPASTIEKLAREYATNKPAALIPGTSAGRTAFGEQFHRATITLAAMTGNVGIHGGDAGARSWESIAGGYPYQLQIFSSSFSYPNPLESSPPSSGWFWLSHVQPQLHWTEVADAVLKGRAGGYPADYKLAFIESHNFVNALPNINKIVKAMKALEFIVTIEHFMNDTARYADIILPSTSFMERELMYPGCGTVFYGFQNKIIEPLGECKTQREIAKELAARMDMSDYDQRDVEGELRFLAKLEGIPDFEDFKKKGVYKFKLPEPYVAFKSQIEDPENNPFPTPSGKIEIYSQQIADMGDPLLPPIPKYIETWESANDPLAKKYPIQLLTNHAKRRANAKMDNIPWLRELEPQTITMNAADARARGIHNGDEVRVFNDRGEVRVPAHVTERIMPGVAKLPAGAWYAPDGNGVDRGGSANVLTRDERSPAGSFAYNTALIQIEKV